MIPRRYIASLLVALCVLLVTVAVVGAGSALARGLGDGLGASVLLWVAAACLLSALVTLVLLVIALGLNQLDGPRPPHRRHHRPPRRRRSDA